MSDIAIKVESLGKLYRLGEVGTGTISHDLHRWWARVRGREDPFIQIGEANDRSKRGVSDYVWALHDIDFQVRQGEVLGVIGRNGAGKSTLLKILSKVTKPTSGNIKIRGRIASLLEVGTGFHPELTGRENIFLNGAILGMTKAEIRSKFDEIVDFSGVERYIDTPVKRYSSGMYVRLAFAVAAFLEPEILIVDEVLAVGDADFQKKCLGRMKDVSVNDGRTVLFVSHNMAAVKSLCTSGIVLKHGTLSFSGNQLEAVKYYQNLHETNCSFEHQGHLRDAPGNDDIRIVKMEVLPQQGDLLTMFSGTEFRIKFYTTLVQKNLDITFEVSNGDEVVIFHNGCVITSENDSEEGFYEVHCRLPRQFLNAGTYNITLIFGESQKHLLYKAIDFSSFTLMQETTGTNSNKLPGLTFPKLEYKVFKSTGIYV